jgi:hypothetical protein
MTLLSVISFVKHASWFSTHWQSRHRLGTSQMHYFSNSLPRRPKCRRGSNKTGNRRTYLIMQLLCFLYAKLRTCHKGEKQAYEITMPRRHAYRILGF